MKQLFRKFACLTMAMVLLFSAVPVQAAPRMMDQAADLVSGLTVRHQENTDVIAEGSNWRLTADGTLAIRDYVNYDYFYGSPWDDHRELITRVELENVTSLPEFCFRYCRNLREVVGMEQVQVIGTKFVIYRQHFDKSKRKIELIKDKPKAKK